MHGSTISSDLRTSLYAKSQRVDPSSEARPVTPLAEIVLFSFLFLVFPLNGRRRRMQTCNIYHKWKRIKISHMLIIAIYQSIYAPVLRLWSGSTQMYCSYYTIKKIIRVVDYKYFYIPFYTYFTYRCGTIYYN